MRLRSPTYIVKQSGEREKMLKDKLLDYFSANPLFVFWNAVLLIILVAHFFYIGFWLDLDLRRALWGVTALSDVAASPLSFAQIDTNMLRPE